MDEEDLLNRVVNREDFARRVLVDDSFDEWELARELGEFLLRIEPDDLTHRLILARAYRHLGDTQLAVEQLLNCERIIKDTKLGDVETELIVPMVSDELRLLRNG